MIEQIQKAVWEKLGLKRPIYTKMPAFIKRYASEKHTADIASYNNNAYEIYADLTTLYAASKQNQQSLINEFNSMSAYFSSISQSIKELAATVSNLESISNESEPKAVYFKDSFANKDYIEDNTTQQCDIAYGIATLQSSSSIKQKLSIVSITGNGELGNQHVVRNGDFIYTLDPKNNPEHMIDDKPDTWTEYQIIKSNQNNQPWLSSANLLRMKIVVALEELTVINWLSILPYYPSKSKKSILINSIRISEDGITYTDITSGVKLMDDTNTIPQTYIPVNALPTSYKGGGIFAFTPQKAKYIEIVIDQDEPYTEQVGYTVYYKVNDTGQKTEIAETEVPDNIKKAPLGTYTTNNGYSIQKELRTFDADRYAIGIRDISVNTFTYNNISEFTSKVFITQKPIRSVTLQVNEYIPEEFTSNLAKRNSWIKYYISFDDINWIQISPMSHMPLNGETLPPKIIAINSYDKQLNIYNYTSDKDIYTVRLKAVFSRPEDMPTATPILLDYAIRAVTD